MTVMIAVAYGMTTGNAQEWHESGRRGGKEGERLGAHRLLRPQEPDAYSDSPTASRASA